MTELTKKAKWILDTKPRIDSIGDLKALVAAGFGDPANGSGDPKHWEAYGQVGAKYHDGLVMFSYSPECAFKPPEAWNYFERVSRGLILNAQTGQIVARPFDKFWNYGQIEPSPGSRIVEVTEKMDGSLGILYWRRGQACVATRGSFESDQAVWATDWLHKNLPWIANGYMNHTLLFEIIYPENRIVVDYKGWSGLVLIGARDTTSGREMSVEDLKKSLGVIAGNGMLRFPKIYTFDGMASILSARESLSGNEEGFVVRYDDGTRLKIKGDEYLQLHKFISNFSFKNVAIAVRDGTIDDLIAVCPQQYRTEMVNHIAFAAGESGQLLDEIEAAYTDVHSYATSQVGDEYSPNKFKRIFALYVQEKYPKLAHYLYAKRDGKLTKTMIYNRLFDL